MCDIKFLTPSSYLIFPNQESLEPLSAFIYFDLVNQTVFVSADNNDSNLKKIEKGQLLRWQISPLTKQSSLSMLFQSVHFIEKLQSICFSVEPTLIDGAQSFFITRESCHLIQDVYAYIDEFFSPDHILEPIPIKQWDVERLDIGILSIDGSDLEHVVKIVEGTAKTMGVVIPDCIRSYLVSEYQSIINKAGRYSFCLIEDGAVAKDVGSLFAFSSYLDAITFSDLNINDNQFEIVVYKSIDELIDNKPKNILTYHLEQSLKRAG